MTLFLDKVKELSDTLHHMTPEQLNEWIGQIQDNSKKFVPVINRSGKMLPPGDYDRPIDKYLDETWGKDSFS